ncbi:Protein arginine N-methyltransferase 6 [Taenia crassiceps]|uniref:type I protein arginine methyltransferase n=1 Tax=Taenia crassiceps TaxID=6207 RepID=A0ABR4QRT7_9CEST
MNCAWVHSKMLKLEKKPEMPIGLTLKANDNDVCADCKSTRVLGLSTDYFVFICKECTEIHVKLGGGWRSLASLNSSTEAELKTLLPPGKGNRQVNEELEAELPIFYRRPWPGPTCPAFFREVFVHYKYIARAFSKGAGAKGLQVGFSNSTKSGQLLKKLRDGTQFAPRLFEINSTTNSLKYYIKLTDTEPKECIDVERCNMTFVNCEAFGVPSNTALIQFVQDHSTRHIFVRSEDSREILNWYNTLRLCKYQRLRLHLSGTGQRVPMDEIASYLTSDLEKIGWLLKSGPDASYTFRRRWVILTKRWLLYTLTPQSAFAKGEIFIGASGDGYSVEGKAPESWKKVPTDYPITLNTPDRSFVFCAASDEERDYWLNAISSIIERPVTLLETKEAAPALTGKRSKIDVDKEVSSKNKDAGNTSDDELYFRSYSFTDVHALMLSDKVRTLTYQLALTRARRRLEGGVLLDVGCGTGILSMFGVKAGAAHVYALDGVASLCRLARKIIAENDFSSHITVINSKIEDAQLGVDRVDAIVSEWMGHALLYENMLPSVLWARDRYLFPPHTSTVDVNSWRRERLFPCRTSIFIAAFSAAPVNGDANVYDEENEKEEEEEEGDGMENTKQWEELSKLYGVNLKGAFASAVRQEFERRVHVDMIDPRCVVTTTSEVAALDLATLSLETLSTHGVKGTFEVKSMGTVLIRGFVIWFSVEFPDGDVLSTSPYKTSTHWQQSLLYLPRPLSLRQDEVLSGEVHFTHPLDAPRDLSIFIDFLVNKSDETRVKANYLLTS